MVDQAGEQIGDNSHRGPNLENMQRIGDFWAPVTKWDEFTKLSFQISRIYEYEKKERLWEPKVMVDSKEQQFSDLIKLRHMSSNSLCQQAHVQTRQFPAWRRGSRHKHSCPHPSTSLAYNVATCCCSFPSVLVDKDKDYKFGWVDREVRELKCFRKKCVIWIRLAPIGS